MSRQPSISVLLIVYSDSQLYKEAIDSVAAQTLSNSDIELVIATSFPQEFTIPKDLDREGRVRVVHSEELTSGGKIRESVRSCGGDIIAFLDYDDTWEVDRLDTVVKAFSETERLGYYHNNCTFVGEDQVPQRGVYRFLAGGRLKSQSGRRLIDPSVSVAAEIRGWMGPGTYNMSSISVRRSLILDFAQRIPNVNLSIEDIIFFNCLNLNNKGMQDTRKLTRVRMHGSNVSNASNRSRNIEHERIAIDSLANLMNLTTNSAIRSCLKSYLPGKELYSQISMQLAGRASVARQFLSYLSSYQSSAILPSPILASMAAGYLFSPTIYTKLLNKRFS